MDWYLQPSIASNLPVTQTKSRCPSIFQINFLFPGCFEKSGFHLLNTAAYVKRRILKKPSIVCDALGLNYKLNTLLSYPGWKSQSDNQSLWPSPVIMMSPLKNKASDVNKLSSCIKTRWVMFDRGQSCFLQRLSRDDLKLPSSERDLLKENLGQLAVYDYR